MAFVGLRILVAECLERAFPRTYMKRKWLIDQWQMQPSREATMITMRATPELSLRALLTEKKEKESHLQAIMPIQRRRHARKPSKGSVTWRQHTRSTQK